MATSSIHKRLAGSERCLGCGFGRVVDHTQEDTVVFCILPGLCARGANRKRHAKSNLKNNDKA